MVLAYRMPFQSSIKNNNLLYNQLLKIIETEDAIQDLKKYDEFFIINRWNPRILAL